MHLGPKGRVLIQSFESLRTSAYRKDDSIWTIGWGHTGPDVTQGTTCTEYQAAQWFDHDTQAACNAVLRTVDVPMTQNEFDALVSFTYNVGAGSEAHSTLVQVLNAGHYMMAAEQFLRWNHIKGVVSAGLTRRREAERTLFLDMST